MRMLIGHPGMTDERAALFLKQLEYATGIPVEFTATEIDELHQEAALLDAAATPHEILMITGGCG